MLTVSGEALKRTQHDSHLARLSASPIISLIPVALSTPLESEITSFSCSPQHPLDSCNSLPTSACPTQLAAPLITQQRGITARPRSLNHSCDGRLRVHPAYSESSLGSASLKMGREILGLSDITCLPLPGRPQPNPEDNVSFKSQADVTASRQWEWIFNPKVKRIARCEMFHSKGSL